MAGATRAGASPQAPGSASGAGFLGLAAGFLGAAKPKSRVPKGTRNQGGAPG
jgi:hypothetical protein